MSSKYKNGDIFLAEIELVKSDVAPGYHTLRIGGQRMVLHEECLENADKITPEYTRGEFYWTKYATVSTWTPRMYADGFYVAGSLLPVSEFYEIGDRVEIPEKYKDGNNG